MLKVFVAGWAVLIVAILLNFLAGKMNVDTWYPFLGEVSKNGFWKAFVGTPIISKLFLLVIYPALLGATAYFVLKFLK